MSTTTSPSTVRAMAQNFIYQTEGKNSEYGRLNCTWVEKRENGEKITHHFVPSINLNDEKVYLDCSKKKLFAKHLCVVLVCIVQTIVKTAYHILFPLSMTIAAYNAYNDKKNAHLNGWEMTKACLKESGKSLLDIFRTPYYGVAMTLTSLAAVISAPFDPTKLYSLRTKSGNLEKEMNWGNRDSNWSFVRCFHPMSSLKSMKKFGETEPNFKDTDYSNVKNAFEKGMAHLTRGHIRFRRALPCNYHPFVRPIGKDQALISPSYPAVRKMIAGRAVDV